MIKWILSVLCIIIVSLISVSLYFSNLDPLTQITHPINQVDATIINSKMTKTVGNENRLYQSILITDKLNSYSPMIFMSIPDTFVYKNQPILFIVGGLNDGETYLNIIPMHENNIIIAFSYPNNAPYWEDQLHISNINNVRQSMMITPHYFAIVSKWIKETFKNSEIHIITYSLGAIFAPSMITVAMNNGVNFGSTSIIYGGIDLNELVSSNLNMGIFSSPISTIITSMINPLDPKHYISKLKGPFLIINGTLDEKIPFQNALRMQAMYPEDKTVINIEEKHMHPKRRELTQRLVNMTLDWLKQIKKIN